MATAEVVRTKAAPWLHRTRQLRACGAQAAASSCGSPPAASRGLPTHPEAHSVVAYMIDSLRAKGLISWQRKVATWWSVDLTTAPTCSADEPIRKAMHRQQTAPRPWSGRRAESYAARGTLHSMCAVAPEPLSSRAPPPEVWRARGRSRPAPCPGRPEVRFVSVRERVKWFTL